MGEGSFRFHVAPDRCLRIHVSHLIRRGVHVFTLGSPLGYGQFGTAGHDDADQPLDGSSLRLAEWPLLMKNWPGFFLARCIRIGEEEVLSVSTLIMCACVCSAVLNGEKQKGTTCNPRDEWSSVWFG